MPALQGVGNCQYTVISGGTNTSTTTLNPGPNAPGPGQSGILGAYQGVLYGASVVSLGTGTTTGTATGGLAQVINAFDVIQPTGIGTNTATVTNTLMNGTASSPGVLLAGLAGVGIRYKGQLVFEVSGSTTPGTTLALWD